MKKARFCPLAKTSRYTVPKNQEHVTSSTNYVHRIHSWVTRQLTCSLWCIDDDEVAHLAHLDGATLAGETHRSSCIDGGRSQRLRQAHLEGDTGQVHHHGLRGGWGKCHTHTHTRTRTHTHTHTHTHSTYHGHAIGIRIEVTSKGHGNSYSRRTSVKALVKAINAAASPPPPPSPLLASQLPFSIIFLAGGGWSRRM